ncbi:hypothetical protein [Nocardia lijiangensis]|uniref:hypothetical protein n=1 Tax=Nocardia lijiangensis TaxID=299618 RepID=UPI000ABF3831|nr:hypothetical protein [Nocardia lijiangensis]
MSEDERSKSPGREPDRVEVTNSRRLFDQSVTAWLIGQGVRYLNAAGEQCELAYRYVTELLQRCDADLLETARDLIGAASAGDAPLRWCLLRILGDSAGPQAAEYLVGVTLERLPESPHDGCKGARNAELLVRTMAVHALGRIAGRHPEVCNHLLNIVGQQPDRAILIEAVKVASALGMKEKVRAMLPKDDRWVLDIRQVAYQSVSAEPEREDGKERGFAPPKRGPLYTAPRTPRCASEEG